MRAELQAARDNLQAATISPDAEAYGLRLIHELGIHSLRAEITLFEAARAHAVADGRETAEAQDVRKTALMALRLRRSRFIHEYLDLQVQEDEEIEKLLKSLMKSGRKSRSSRRSK